MQGLMLRLSQLDAQAANAVRVIGFFDQLVERRASLTIVISSAAALAECPVGFSSPGPRMSLRAEPGADPTPSPDVPPGAAAKRLSDGTVVWLERAGDPAPLDDMLLERLAIVVAIRLEHASVPLPQLGDPALVEQVLSPHASKQQARALQLLGLKPESKVRVLAATDATAIEGRATKRGSAWGILCIGPVPESLPHGTRLGVGPQVPAKEAAKSWHAARNALRFTTACEPIVHFEQLGCLGVLADRLDHADLAQMADLTALDRLADEHGGEAVAVLNALCMTGSNRQAAAILHRHHSTIPTRLTHARKVLGFPLDTPAGRFRLQLALTLRRLRDNPK